MATTAIFENFLTALKVLKSATNFTFFVLVAKNDPKAT